MSSQPGTGSLFGIGIFLIVMRAASSNKEDAYSMTVYYPLCLCS
jgi:hypothetical protein